MIRRAITSSRGRLEGRVYLESAEISVALGEGLFRSGESSDRLRESGEADPSLELKIRSSPLNRRRRDEKVYVRVAQVSASVSSDAWMPRGCDILTVCNMTRFFRFPSFPGDVKEIYWAAARDLT